VSGIRNKPLTVSGFDHTIWLQNVLLVRRGMHRSELAIIFKSTADSNLDIPHTTEVFRTPWSTYY